MEIRITVPGNPVPKARPRVTYHGTFTPKKTKDYEELVQYCWLEQSGKRFPDDAMLEMDVKAYFQIPKSFSKKRRAEMEGRWHTSRPATDNLVKCAADSLNGAAYKDDSVICRVTATKAYSVDPRLEIIIKEMEENRCTTKD
jgi:Holliday junction resolvase RusA-like endonuclease